MGPPPPGFRLAFDVTPFDGAWVLLPGLLALGLAALLLLVGVRGGELRRRRRWLMGAGLLGLGAVWWTLGGLGAWRAGALRLASGTANFVEGVASAPVLGPGGRVDGFRVGGLSFRRRADALLPAFHAGRWPTVALGEGQRVRVWFFEEDILRLEVGGAP
jgi:hypothetical protein